MAELPPAQPRYEAQVAHIWEPHTTLPALIRMLECRLYQPPLRGRSQLIVEAPAACRPWIDQIRQASLQLVAVQLQEGGAAPSHVGSNWVVSPELLDGTQELLLQMDRLHFSEHLSPSCRCSRRKSRRFAGSGKGQRRRRGACR